MNKNQELKFRCSLGLDFIIQSVQDDILIPEYKNGQPVNKDSSLELNLRAISLLSFCGDFFSRSELTSIASRMFDKILQYRFDHFDSACIIKNDQSHTSWNLKIASAYLKNQNLPEASKFLKTLENSIVGNSKVNFFYIPGTHNDILNQSPDASGSIGELALIFLFANRYINKYSQQIARISEVILKHGRFDPLDVWFVRLLNDQQVNLSYKTFADHIVGRMNSIALPSMSSLVAAVALQSNLAWSDKDNSNNGRIEQLLEYQLSLQNLKTGAFERTASNDEIRLDYTIQNTIAILLYLSRVEGEKMDILSLLT